MEESVDLCSGSQPEKRSRGRPIPEDRISSLSDDVILLILSFLTFKEIARTSILSVRWMNLWLKTPVLDFHAPVSDAKQIDNRVCQNFVEWVNNVLREHQGHHLKEFKIVCSLNEDYREDINRWLEFALARKVQSLELNLLLSGCECDSQGMIFNYVFPDWFLSGKASLGGGESRLLQFDLKCLKSLSLKNVHVSGEAFNLFLLNCPLLERLEVVASLKLANLVISDPNLALKYLQIKHCQYLKVLSISNVKLVSLDISFVGDLTLRDLPMLVELSIAGNSYSLKRYLFQASSFHAQLEVLTLQTLRLKNMTRLSNLAQLTKLKRLVLILGSRGDESLIMLVSIIKSCRHLNEFSLMLIWNKPEQTSRTVCEVERLSNSSSLISDNLKVFEFKGYYGRVSDVELIMHVVENAPGLEKIIIDPRNVLIPSGPNNRSETATATATEQEARSYALQQFDSLRDSLPSRVHLLIR